MRLIVDELRAAVPLIFHGDPYVLSTLWFTLEVAAISTAASCVIGIPLGLAIALGRFRGRRMLHLLANVGLAVPPVLLGLILFLLLTPESVLGGLQLLATRRVVFIAQALLAVPYVVALTAAAILGLGGGLLAQARALGAGRLHVSVLALREARIGVFAAVMAALGTTLSEVGAIVVVGGNIYGYNQTLASGALYEAEAAHYAQAIALGILLSVLILLLLGTLGLLQHQGAGIRMRFRWAR
jgi:tungstate transport system permease protein